jgi:mRNA interferase MazF
MKRGDVCLVDLEPALGSRANKRLPAAIVSNDGANETAVRLGRGVVTVVPITSNLERVHPFQVGLPAAKTGLDRDSKAEAERVCSISVGRVGSKLGVVPSPLLAELDEALRLHLAL